MREYIDLPSISDVAPGNTVTINLPVGKTYDKVKLEYSGVTLEQLTDIRLELDGRMVSEWADGTRIEDVDDYYKRPKTGGVLNFNFLRSEMDKLGEARFFGLGTKGVKTAVIKLRIASDAAGPVVLTAFAEKSASTEPGWLTKTRRQFFSQATSGEFQVDNIILPPGSTIAAIHLRKEADDITDVESRIDGVSWQRLKRAMNESIQTEWGRAPQPKYYTLDYFLQGETTQALQIPSLEQVAQNQALKINDFRLIGHCDTAGQIEIIIEYLQKWSPNGF